MFYGTVYSHEFTHTFKSNDMESNSDRENFI